MGTNTNVGAPTAGAALGIVLVAIIEGIAKTDLTLTVEGAIVVLATLALGFLVPPTRGSAASAPPPPRR